MNTWSRGLGAVALVAVIATGCAGDPPATTNGSESSAGPSGGGADHSDDAARTQTSKAAVSVRVVVTGGIAGAHDVYEVSRADAASTSAMARRILALASAPAVRDFGTQRQRPAVRCCDVQVYEVTVRYADGARTKITTDTMSAPPEVQHLVALLSTGQQSQ
jgi:hypothetical protein